MKGQVNEDPTPTGCTEERDKRSIMLSGFWNRDDSLTILLIATIAVSVLLRVSLAVYLGNDVSPLPGIADQLTYNTLAQRFLSGHGFTFGEGWWPVTRAGEPTAHWSFLYTFYLSLVYRLFGASPAIARLVQAFIVGFAQPLLIFAIGRRVFNPIVGLVAAVLTAAYAYFIYYSAALMTEPFYITTLLAVLYLSIRLMDPEIDARDNRKRVLFFYILLGLTLGATVLLRQIFLFFVPFLLLAIGWVNRKRDGTIQTFINVALTLLVVVFMILPFTVYNYQRFGQMVLLNTNAGFAFFWANHPIYGNTFQAILSPDLGNYGDLIPPELKSLDEAALDRALLLRGLQFVVDDPIRYFRLSLSRIPIYFMFWPSAGSSLMSNIVRVFSFGLLWPFMLYGSIVSLKERWQTQPSAHAATRLLLVFVVVYTGIHILSWALIRYRLPVDSVLMLFAAVGFVDLSNMFRNRWRLRFTD